MAARGTLLSEGWHELLSRGSNALTHFTHRKEDEKEADKDVIVRETDVNTYHLMDGAYDAFQRTIPLPRNVSVEHAQAKFKNGLLTVRLPKMDTAKSKSIPVL